MFFSLDGVYPTLTVDPSLSDTFAAITAAHTLNVYFAVKPGVLAASNSVTFPASIVATPSTGVFPAAN